MQYYAEEGTIYKRHPVTTRYAEGSTFDFDKITVDDVIKLDHSTHVGNVDKTHLLLKGDIPDGDHYLRVKNSNGTLLNINHNGKLHAFAGISSPEITNITSVLTQNVSHIETNIDAIDTLDSTMEEIGAQVDTHDDQIDHLNSRILDAEPVTAEAVDHSLVLRRNLLGTKIKHLIADTQLTVEKNGKLNYQPWHMHNGVYQPKVGWLFRFGRAEEQADVGDDTQDGLEFISPTGNEIRLQVNKAAPTIETVNNKNYDVWVRHRDSFRDSQYEINQYGGHTRIHNTQHINVTPGVPATVQRLAGVTDYIITLAANWVFANTSEISLEIFRQEGNEYMLYAFCFIRIPFGGTNIMSRVFIKRRTNIVKNDHTRREKFILGAESGGGENKLLAGIQIVLRVREQVLLS